VLFRFFFDVTSKGQTKTRSKIPHTQKQTTSTKPTQGYVQSVRSDFEVTDRAGRTLSPEIASEKAVESQVLGTI